MSVRLGDDASGESRSAIVFLAFCEATLTGCTFLFYLSSHESFAAYTDFIFATTAFA